MPEFDRGTTYTPGDIGPDTDQSGASTSEVKYNPREDFYYNSTQKIANNLPEWNKIRKWKQSNGQKLINALWGCHLDDLNKKINSFVRQRHLSLVEMDQPDVVEVCNIPDELRLSTSSVLTNYIRNSNFQIRSYGSRLPDYWQFDSSEASYSIVDGYLGHRALRITVDDSSAGGNSLLTQEIHMRIGAGEYFTFSFYYRLDGAQTSGATYNYDWAARIYGVQEDNVTTQMSVLQMNTDGTNNKWVRITGSGTFLKEVFKVIVNVGFSKGSTDVVDRYVDVDCFQFERGKYSTPWSPNLDDRFFYQKTRNPSPVLVFGDASSATYVDNNDDFWDNAFPTRIELVHREPASVQETTSAGRIPLTDFWKDTYYWSFKVASTTSQLSFYDTAHQTDIIRDFYVAFRNYENLYQIDDTVEFDRLTFFAGKLWALTAANELVVIEPKFPWPAPTYLQAISSVKIDTGGSNLAAGTSIKMEFRNEDRQHIYIYDNNYVYQYRLYYDFFLVDAASRRVFLREQYTNLRIV